MATLVIAEAGVNHNGDLGLALELVEAAASAGADAVKFQTFTAASLASANAPKAEYQEQNDGTGTQQEMLEKLELTPSEHVKIASHCRKHNINFLSTAFGKSEMDLLLDLGIGAIKVPSGEITNRPLLEYFAAAAFSNNKPVYLSTGMSSLGEIEECLSIFMEAGLKRKDITLLHCLSAYPAPEEQVNLRAMQSMAGAFGCPVGYSDHTLGINAAIAAVALGAVLIEKHITLDNSLPGPDHKASLMPNEFRRLVSAIRSCEKMLGDGYKRPQPSEKNTREVARRSIRAARSIKKGDFIITEDIVCQRPGDGISPMRVNEVIGSRASQNYCEGDLIGG